MEEIGTILEPDPIAFSFDALGWTYLLCFLVVLSVLMTVVWIIRYWKNRHKRAAIAMIKNESDIRAINIVLKAIALRSFDRTIIASLAGKDWMGFLLGQLKQAPFQKDSVEQVMSMQWRAQSPNPEELQLMRDFSIYWIRNHHV